MAEFSAWYLANDRRSRDMWEHGMTAGSRRELMRKVERKCPGGYRIKAIHWQRRGKGDLQRVWYAGRWIDDTCRQAFGK